jgi:hypothetical protein
MASPPTRPLSAKRASIQRAYDPLRSTIARRVEVSETDMEACYAQGWQALQRPESQLQVIRGVSREWRAGAVSSPSSARRLRFVTAGPAFGCKNQIVGTLRLGKVERPLEPVASPLTRLRGCALALVQRAGRGTLVLPGRAFFGGIRVRMPVVGAFRDRGARDGCCANSQRGERKQRGHHFASSTHGFLSEMLISTSYRI